LIFDESLKTSIISFFAFGREKTPRNLSHLTVISNTIAAFMTL
jgi:hypothetical protein